MDPPWNRSLFNDHFRENRYAEQTIAVDHGGASLFFTFLATCTTGNYLQSFEQIKKDYQKTNEIEPLIEALNHTDLRIRVLAANYLGETKDARAIGPLQEALDDRSRYVREEAKVALEKLGEIPQTRPNDSDVADASLEGIDVQKSAR
jgi:hypothetical protein